MRDSLIGQVVLLELFARLSFGIDIERDSIGILDPKPAITPRMVFKRQHHRKPFGRQPFVLGVHVLDAEVVREPPGSDNRCSGP